MNDVRRSSRSPRPDPASPVTGRAQKCRPCGPPARRCCGVADASVATVTKAPGRSHDRLCRRLSSADSGAPGRDRTYDLGIRSPLLYPLSYERMSSDRLPPTAEDSLVGSQIDALRTASIVVRHKRVPLVRRGLSQRVAAGSRFGSFGLVLVSRPRGPPLRRSSVSCSVPTRVALPAPASPPPARRQARWASCAHSWRACRPHRTCAPTQA